MKLLWIQSFLLFRKSISLPGKFIFEILYTSSKDSKLPFIRNEAVFSSKVNLRESVSLTGINIH